MMDTGGHWVTMAEAAAILGKSTRTIRRYIADGKLEIDKTRSPNLVDVGPMADMADSGGQKRTETQGLEAEAQDLRARISELEATNELLQELLREVREERDYLRSANAAALSKIPNQGPSLWRRLLPWIKGEDE